MGCFALTYDVDAFPQPLAAPPMLSKVGDSEIIYDHPGWFQLVSARALLLKQFGGSVLQGSEKGRHPISSTTLFFSSPF